jgi:hypothetical protein
LTLDQESKLDPASLASHLISPLEALQEGLGMLRVVLSDSDQSDLQNGRRLRIEPKRIPTGGSATGNQFLAVDKDQNLLAVLEWEQGSPPCVSVAVKFSGYWRKLDHE